VRAKTTVLNIDEVYQGLSLPKSDNPRFVVIPPGNRIPRLIAKVLSRGLRNVD